VNEGARCYSFVESESVCVVRVNREIVTASLARLDVRAYSGDDARESFVSVLSLFADTSAGLACKLQERGIS